MLPPASFILCICGHPIATMQTRWKKDTWQGCVWYGLWQSTRHHSVLRNQPGTIHPLGCLWFTTGPSSYISLNLLPSHSWFRRLFKPRGFLPPRKWRVRVWEIIAGDWLLSGSGRIQMRPLWPGLMNRSLHAFVISSISCSCLTSKYHAKEWWIPGISRSFPDFFVAKPREGIYHKSIVLNVFASIQTDYRWRKHFI